MKFVCKLILFFSFFVISIQNAFTQNNQIHALRLELQEARKDWELSNQLYQKISSKTTVDIDLLNCQATSCLLQGLHSKNITQQNTYISEAQIILNKAIGLDSTNLESRFLRFSIESALPFYYYKKKHIQEDKEFLKANFKSNRFNPYSFRYIEEMYHVLEQSKQFSAQTLIKMQTEVNQYQKELAKK